ncbi:hypothetical protein J2Z32_001296 [Paenibacillus turicensis]|uniref:Uncharacterized protein n=1 Tax=Paenibacillus turicensis TaxID=160487 RepID=A0ABS4FQ05_9BACL|nr:hypothetical protein [Paenibacillus turicensis]MBP1904673.1 hypothetical protein [Paenibacillus turicensis]
MSKLLWITPKDYVAFENEAEAIDKCKEWGLVTPKATKMKAFYHKGTGKNIACEIVGYVDDITSVIKLETGELHLIHPSYLKEMQAASYGNKGTGTGSESRDNESTSNEGISHKTVDDEAISDEAAEMDLDAVAKIEEVVGEKPSLATTVETLEGVVDISFPSEDEALSPEPIVKLKESKAKKAKQPKLELPVDKVKMSAKVAEFTTVPNHFSESEDEVIIYEEVKVIEPELLIGEAWSSHSATMKKQELEVGDVLTFEAKIVAKKLTKHPVAYKINNPSKIQKNEES